METRRDPFLDLCRVGAMLLVVVQHWLMPVLGHDGQGLRTGNALATPGWWLVTWFSQVMPVVFFAGGAANLLSYRRASSGREWLATRLGRLALPVLPLLAVWVVAPPMLLSLGVDAQAVGVAGAITAQLLWFLVVYLVVVLVTPLLVRAHDRWGTAVLLPLAAVAAAVDVVRFTSLEQAGFLNAVLVWVAVHQLGFAYADGTLTRSRSTGPTLMAVGYAVTAALVALGPYAASMIGMPGAPMSNMTPPAAVLLPLTVGQVGLLLTLRPTLLRLAARPRPARLLATLGTRTMTIYLWHMPALVVVAGITVVGLGYTTPEPGTLLWWLAAPFWLGATTAVLAWAVHRFSRFEHLKPAKTLRSTAMVRAGILTTAAGLLGLTVFGFTPSSPGLWSGPLPWAALVLAGMAVAGVLPRTQPVDQPTRATVPA